MDEPRDISLLLHRWESGDRSALDELFPVVYDELRKQARAYLRRERQNHTLQTTALIHEAYLKLVDQRSVKLADREHFFAIAATMMRRVLVDHARTKHRLKRGGPEEQLPLDEAIYVVADEGNVDLIALDNALNKLAEFDADQARLVELRYFSGLSLDAAAEAMGISRATAVREWAIAKAWLHRELTK